MRGGWFHSGDAAVVHPDGYVEIRDRFKDVIISGGENISSVEVEGVLLRHPAVMEAAVVGVPDDEWGEAPHGFVVLKPGAAATEDELRAVRARAARALQGAARVHVRGRAAEDGDRQDPEVRPARRPRRDFRAIAPSPAFASCFISNPSGVRPRSELAATLDRPTDGIGGASRPHR